MRLMLKARSAIVWIVSVVVAGYALADVNVAFLYKLSNFSGVLPYSGVQIHADRFHDEVYVGEGDVVRVFNSSGMEVFEFIHDAMKLGSILAFATDENGEIFILSYCSLALPCQHGAVISLYNYRGELQRSFAITGLPEALAAFIPNRMLYRGKKLIFASTTALTMVVTDAAGAYESHLDLLEGLELDDHARDGAELGGFDVDASGTVLYTIPTAFRAFRRKLGEKAEAWGKSGSARGTFGVVGAITTDDSGDVVVADKARSVVLVFAPDLSFVKEFGSSGARDARLVGPQDLALGNGGKLYVTQLASRGVAVFSLTPP
jgi:hypothetical protein